jgi:lysozyme
MYNLDEIKNSEGLELIAYKRKGDVWTIGYGSTYYEDNTRIKKGDIITKERAETLLIYKITKEYIPQLKRCLKVPLNDNQFSAMLSLIYNIGAGNLRKSKLLGLVNNNPNDLAIKAQWLITNIRVGSQFEKGLRLRRMREVELYFKPL